MRTETPDQEYDRKDDNFTAALIWAGVALVLGIIGIPLSVGMGLGLGTALSAGLIADAFVMAIGALTYKAWVVEPAWGRRNAQYQ